MSDVIKIGPIDFLLLIAHQTEQTETTFLGALDTIRDTITINADLSVRAAKIAVWHEVCHAILRQSGFENQSEEEITALSHGIVSALIENEILRMNE